MYIWGVLTRESMRIEASLKTASSGHSSLFHLIKKIVNFLGWLNFYSARCPRSCAFDHNFNSLCFCFVFPRDRVLQRPPEIIPVFQTQYYTCKLHSLSPLKSCNFFIVHDRHLIACSLPLAPHASFLHLLSGSGAGPGAECGPAAGQQHPAQPNLHSGRFLSYWLIF